MDAWSFVSSKNDYVVNRSGEWLQERYQKHQPIEAENDWTNERPTDPPTDRSKLCTIARQTWQTTAWWSQGQSRTVTQGCAQLLNRPNKQLFGEAKENRERIRKRPESQTNEVANNRLNDRGRATHPRVVGLRQTLPKNDWLNARMSTSTARGLRSGLGARGLKPARGQEPTAEALRFRKFKRLM